MPASRLFLRRCATLAIAALLSVPAQADPGGFARTLPSPDTVQRIASDRTTLAPFSYILFCQRHPGDCQGGARTAIDWDLQARLGVAWINLWVNHLMRPQHDGTDVWDAGLAAGDCEDFALTKRQILIRAGLPAASLQMAVARIRSGEGHAVLVLRTSDGDLVLDNRNDQLSEWHHTDLTWLKIASAENPRIWYAIN